MKFSKQAQRGARELYRCCLVNGALDENRVRRAVALVLARKPHGYIEILSRLLQLVKLDFKRRTACVESTAPLPPDLKEKVTKQLKRIYGAAMNISFVQNPALIGGLRIQAGSDLYDGSVRARLNALAQQF
ncbi:MAG TPA: F0F1 ATP synthase subunit delta [Verrucomicrobiae bacterium]|nr:F0F1 ATP synthase subunit delta [Verrucomicrobiae bacterium]